MLRAGTLLVLVGALPALAAPVLRHTEEVRGDMILIGNTLAHDCRYATAPVVGTVGACGSNSDDSGVDVFWQSDSTPGAATANTGHSSGRSKSVLSLPVGATITYARLYWAAENGSVDTTATLQTPSGSSSTITADGSSTATASGRSFYQSGANITALVQAAGPGAYTVSGVSAVNPVNRDDEVNFAAWSMVIFYELTTDPPRNLTLFDGLDQVVSGVPASATVSGFIVPDTSFGAKLGVIAYEGDNVVSGDRLRFNSVALSDGFGGTNNFFNSTRTRLGSAVTVAGDLPQLSGGAASMSGLDLDVVDVTAQLLPGSTSASIEASSTGDTYLLGALVTSISTLKPLFTETVKSYVDLNGGQVLPGDQVEYTITTHNSGSDTAVELWVEDVLPAGVTYQPGSLEILTGPNAGPVSDLLGDDAGEYETGAGRVVVRLGAGATPTLGGTLGTADGSTSVRFRVQVNAGATGLIVNQAVVHATGELSGDVLTFLSGIPGIEEEPTRFQVAPNTVIDSAPPSLTPLGTATFAFSSPSAGATFLCSRDGAALTVCTSPISYTGLGAGAHTFAVAAVDGTEQDATPATHGWTVDAVAPDTTILTAPPSLSTTTAASFTFSATEAGSTFQCRLDAGGWASCISPVSTTVGQGSHTWEVRATDGVGNQDPSAAGHTWSVDSLPPAAPVVTAPLEAALLAQDTVTLGGTSEPGTVVSITVDGIAVGTALTNASGLWELTNVGPLSEGAHAVEAVAGDAAGNLSPPGLSSFRTDTVPPETTVDTGPTALIASSTAVFDLGSNESPVIYRCSLDGVSPSDCPAHLELNDLAEGPHLLSVFATDEAGNADPTPATHAWTVDTVAPDTTLEAQPANPSASRTGTFAFSSSEPSSTFQCQLDGAGAFASCPSPSTFTNLPSGPHSFQVRAVDAAGNVDPTPAFYAWTVNGDRDGDGLLDLDEATHGTDPDDADTDDDGLSDGLEVESGRTSPLDDDSDDDGLGDGTEDASADGLVSVGETDGAARDSDGDGLTDGLELGLTTPEGTGTDLALFVADLDPSTQTDPLLTDTDQGGVWDGYEDRNHNGRTDPGETHPLQGSDDLDADGDGLHNEHEEALGLDPFDSDTDDDGIADGADGILDSDSDGLIDAADPDSDNDGLPDGLEAGVTAATAPAGTDQGSAAFVPDQDPTTTTDPKVADSDHDGLADGAEDLDRNGRYDPDETDPLLADTDRGGLLDGVEREHGLDPTWDGDDWGVGGSGCSSSGGGLSSLSLLVLAGLWLRRRLARLGRAALAAALLLWVPGAQAQTTAPKSTAIDVQQFKPAPGGSDLLSLHSALIPEHFSWQVGLLGSYGNEPLTVTNPITGQATSAVVAHQVTFDLYGSIGLFQRLELGVALPLTVQGTQSDPFDGQTLRGAGVGDLRLVPKARILTLAGIELAAALPVILPTGGESSFLGGGGLAVQPRVIAEWAPGPLRVIANLGLNFRRTEQLQNLHVGHAFTYGAGLEVPMQLPVIGDLALGGTLAGSLGLIQNDPEERPLELLLMGRWTSFIPGLRVVGGGGPGLTHGYGTPRFRLFLGVDWSPGGRQTAPKEAAVTPASTERG